MYHYFRSTREYHYPIDARAMVPERADSDEHPTIAEQGRIAIREMWERRGCVQATVPTTPRCGSRTHSDHSNIRKEFREAPMHRKIGDVVRLKSGGPDMTVRFCNADNSLVVCEWFAGKKLESSQFHSENLIEASAPDAKLKLVDSKPKD
jgi:uncharacterized protein YodC (DUF2158 family)